MNFVTVVSGTMTTVPSVLLPQRNCNCNRARIPAVSVRFSKVAGRSSKVQYGCATVQCRCGTLKQTLRTLRFGTVTSSIFKSRMLTLEKTSNQSLEWAANHWLFLKKADWMKDSASKWPVAQASRLTAVEVADEILEVVVELVLLEFESRELSPEGRIDARAECHEL